MRLFIGITVVAMALAAAVGCPLEDRCPEGVALDGSEMPCSCGMQVLDALPGDGSTCVCDPDEGLVCEPMYGDCPMGVELDGSESPCWCGEEIVDGLPGDGSICTCTETEGLVCEAPPSGTDCPLDVELDGSELPCVCAGTTIDALPGHGGACWCDATRGFTCDAISSCEDGDCGSGADADGDGFAAPEDCDDSDPAVSPAAHELCNGVDDDCDGEVDEDCPVSS